MMQQRFLPLTAPVGVMTAVLVMVGVACGNGEGVSPTGPRAALSGEEVFHGLVFHEGAVVALLPELGHGMTPRKLTPEQRDARERWKARLVADMRQADPTFFERFGADIQSGDHPRIEQAMHEGAVLVKRLARKAAPMPGSVRATCCSEGHCDYDYTDYDQASASDWVLASTVDYAYDWSWAADYVIPGDDDGGGESGWRGTRLGRDQVIEIIAARLVAGR